MLPCSSQGRATPGGASPCLSNHTQPHAAASVLVHTMQPTCAHIPLPLSVQPFLPRLMSLKLARLPRDFGSVPVM